MQAELVEVDLVLVDVGLDTFASRREAIEVSAATAEQLQERVETLLAEGDRTKANLAAMQRDRDALAAEVRTLRVAVAEKVRNAPERPEVVGKVVSEHGPCEDGEELVRDVVAHTAGSWLSNGRRLFILERLTAGEAKYGTPLRVGWSRAREALDEEMADAIAYAIAAGDDAGAKALAVAWERMPSLGGEE